jgi:hypothetical protein
MNLLAMVMAATKVPENLTFEQRLMIVVCPDSHQAVGKWLGYDMINMHRLHSGIWRIHLIYLFNSIPTDMLMNEKTVNKPTTTIVILTNRIYH